MTPDLSVIIPVYNRTDVIRPTLESVRRASREQAGGKHHAEHVPALDFRHEKTETVERVRHVLALEP